MHGFAARNVGLERACIPQAADVGDRDDAAGDLMAGSAVLLTANTFPVLPPVHALDNTRPPCVAGV